MNKQQINKIKKGYTFTFDVPSIMSIKHSPNEQDSLLCEHQYGERYTFSYETLEDMYFAIYKNGMYLDCEWKIEKETRNLYVYIKNRVSERWESYIPGEYMIKLL